MIRDALFAAAVLFLGTLGAAAILEHAWTPHNYGSASRGR